MPFKSELFQNEDDKLELTTIMSILQVTLPYLSDIPIKHIAEFSVGKIYVCQKASCEKEVFILHKHLDNYSHSKAINLGFKYCNVLKSYFCSEHMNAMVPNSRCMNDGLYDPSLEQNQCNGCKGMYVCHDQCYGDSCHNCDQFIKACSKCRFSADIEEGCHVCGFLFCNDCSSFKKFGSFEYKLCLDCVDETLIICKKCNDEQILGFKGNTWIGPQWEMCLDCNRWICLKCSDNNPYCDNH